MRGVCLAPVLARSITWSLRTKRWVGSLAAGTEEKDKEGKKLGLGK